MRLLFNKNKPFLSYKPTTQHYIKALKRTDKTDITKLVYLYIKIASMEKMDYHYYVDIEPLLGLLTPKEYKQMFPITKVYDGDEDFKDYLNVTEELDYKYIDDLPLCGHVYEFLMDYLNPDTDMFMVNLMSAVSHRHEELYGKDIFEEFFGDIPKHMMERNPMDDYNIMEI